MKTDVSLMTLSTFALLALAVVHGVLSGGDLWTFVLIYVSVGSLYAAELMMGLVRVDDDTGRSEVLVVWLWHSVAWFPELTIRLTSYTVEYLRRP